MLQTAPARPLVHTAVYYPLFDYLRIVLATAVAVVHSGLPLWHHAGGLAVQIFFALSGWLIGGILLRSTAADLPRFYFNRATRIWIPYFVAIALLIVASLLKEKVTAKWVEIFFYDITFVYNFFGPPQLAAGTHLMPLDGTGNHLWSICAEEQFYLIAPLLLTLVPALFSRSIVAWIGIAIAIYLSPFGYYFGAIAFGVIGAIAKDRFGDWHLAPAAIATIAAALVLSVAGMLVYDPGLMATPFPGIVAISTVLLFARPGKASRFGQFVGGVSYPMYLNHWIGTFIANFLAKPLGMLGHPATQVSSVIVALAVASVLYVVVDRTVMRYRSNFYSPALGRASAVVGFALVVVGLTVGGILTYRPT